MYVKNSLLLLFTNWAAFELRKLNSLQQIHLITRLDGSGPSKVVIHRRSWDLSNTPHLRGQVACHGVQDRQSTAVR